LFQCDLLSGCDQRDNRLRYVVQWARLLFITDAVITLLWLAALSCCESQSGTSVVLALPPADLLPFAQTRRQSATAAQYLRSSVPQTAPQTVLALPHAADDLALPEMAQQEIIVFPHNARQYMFVFQHTRKEIRALSHSAIKEILVYRYPQHAGQEDNIVSPQAQCCSFIVYQKFMFANATGSKRYCSLSRFMASNDDFFSLHQRIAAHGNDGYSICSQAITASKGIMNERSTIQYSADGATTRKVQTVIKFADGTTNRSNEKTTVTMSPDGEATRSKEISTTSPDGTVITSTDRYTSSPDGSTTHTEEHVQKTVDGIASHKLLRQCKNADGTGSVVERQWTVSGEHVFPFSIKISKMLPEGIAVEVYECLYKYMPGGIVYVREKKIDSDTGVTMEQSHFQHPDGRVEMGYERQYTRKPQPA
jgi:hypothetical protein